MASAATGVRNICQRMTMRITDIVSGTRGPALIGQSMDGQTYSSFIHLTVFAGPTHSTSECVSPVVLVHPLQWWMSMFLL